MKLSIKNQRGKTYDVVINSLSSRGTYVCCHGGLGMDAKYLHPDGEWRDTVMHKGEHTGYFPDTETAHAAAVSNLGKLEVFSA